MEDINDDEYIKSLGKRIRTIRKEKKLTQLEVAVSANMEENAVQRIEAGRTNPTTKTLLRISRVLGTEVKELFEFSVQDTGDSST